MGHVNYVKGTCGMLVGLRKKEIIIIIIITVLGVIPLVIVREQRVVTITIFYNMASRFTISIEWLVTHQGVGSLQG